MTLRNDPTLIRQGLWVRWFNALMQGKTVKAGILFQRYRAYINGW